MCLYVYVCIYIYKYILIIYIYIDNIYIYIYIYLFIWIYLKFKKINITFIKQCLGDGNMMEESDIEKPSRLNCACSPNNVVCK